MELPENARLPSGPTDAVPQAAYSVASFEAIPRVKPYRLENLSGSYRRMLLETSNAMKVTREISLVANAR